jgi:branched-chain amino acid transport system permease protein
VRSVLKLAGIAALLAFPFVISSPYYLHLLVVIAIYSILTLGLDVVFGYTGEVSLGHAALFGIGAYTAGVMSFQLGIGLFPSIPLGILIACGFGALLALPALRVTGPYLAMVTLAFGTIVQILINEMSFLTNGPMGISLRQPVLFDWREYGEAYPWLEMSLARMRSVQFYYIVVVALLVTLLVVGGPSRRCATARSRRTAWASRSTSTRCWPSWSAPGSPGWRACCSPIPSNTSRRTISASISRSPSCSR